MSMSAFPLDLRPWFITFVRSRARLAAASLGPGELESVVDLAALVAWRRYDPRRGASFATFARKAVLGAVRRAAARQRLAERALAQWASLHVESLGWEPPRAEGLCAVRQIGARLEALDRVLLERVVVEEESVDEVARALALPRTTVWRRVQEAKALAREGRWRRAPWAAREEARRAPGPRSRAKPLPSCTTRG